MNETSGSPKIAGVIGWPVAHSLSPKLHGFWLQQYGVDGLYVPLEVRKEDFACAVQVFRQSGFAGLNVTLPYKEAAFALASEYGDAAAATRAANLLIFGEGEGIAARNTDVYGFRTSIVQALGPDAIAGSIAVVLGAGGAARAVALALDELGAAEIRIVNRSARRAEMLVSELAPLTKSRLVHAQDDTGVADVGAHAAILVNATSAGLNGGPPPPFLFESLPSTCAVCDLVYKPLDTEFLKRAGQHGLKTVDGLGMLMHQAVPSFAAFYGVTPEVTPALRHVLEQALAS